MNLAYHNPFEESNINLTDFKCSEGRELLTIKGLYKIIWTKEDVKNITIDGCSFSLKPETVLFCTPLNYIEIPEGTSSLLGLMFNREFYCIRDNDNEVSCNGFLFYGSSQPAVIQLTKEQEDFRQLYRNIEEEFGCCDNSQGEMIRSLLKVVIIKSTRLAKKEIYQSPLSEEKYDLIRKFHILVEQNFKSYHKVQDYAGFLNKSHKTVSNFFKKHSEKTPLTIINERILLEARRLLLFSNKTAEEIGYEIGFKEAGHFSKFFKTNMGQSPITFKNQMVEKETSTII